MTTNDAPRRERLLLLCLLAAACLTMAHFVHEAWFVTESAALAHRAELPGPEVHYAPDAYRVAMPLIVPALQHALHLGSSSYAGAALDFVFGLGALVLLYLLVIEELAPPQCFAAGISFLALIQFPLAWVVPHQRPETMSSAFYVALTLYAASRRTRPGLWTAVLIFAAVLQSFFRTDVTVALGVSLALVAVVFGSRAPSGKRTLTLSRGVALAVIGGGIQWYLQTVRFPHLTYSPGTPVFQLLNNLQFHNFSAALLALFPCGLPLLLVRRSQMFRSVELLVLTAAALYLVLWLTVGVAAEVRIFVPFLLALCVVSARRMALAFAPEKEN